MILLLSRFLFMLFIEALKIRVYTHANITLQFLSLTASIYLTYFLFTRLHDTRTTPIITLLS